MRKKVEVTRQALLDICLSVVGKIMEKNADYGDAWQAQGMNGSMVRLADKLYRVENLADGREMLVQGESLEDTLIDAIGYSLLGLLYIRAGTEADGAYDFCLSHPAKFWVMRPGDHLPAGARPQVQHDYGWFKIAFELEDNDESGSGCEGCQD